MSQIVVVTAFGRKFHASENGLLLDADGAETQFRVMDLEIRMEAQPYPHRFAKAKPGDSVAFSKPTVINGAIHDVETYEHILLIRDGRVVDTVVPYAGVMLD